MLPGLAPGLVPFLSISPGIVLLGCVVLGSVALVGASFARGVGSDGVSAGGVVTFSTALAVFEAEGIISRGFGPSVLGEVVAEWGSEAVEL
jgi:hypothetical protein